MPSRRISSLNRRRVRARATAPGIELCEARLLLADNAFLQGIVTDSVTSLPLAGATVMLHKLDSPPIPDEMVTTAADGLYQFQNLPPGQYRITETPPAGYVNDGTQSDSPLTKILNQTSSSIDVQLSDPTQLQLSYPSHNKEVITTTTNGLVTTSLTGQSNISINEPDVGYTSPLFPSFCVDKYRPIATGDQNLPYSMEQLDAALAADPKVKNPGNAGEIAYLYNQFGSTWSTNPAQYVPVSEAAGFQLAIWELEYETSGTYDVLTGSFFAHGLSSSSPEVVAAQGFIAQAQGQNELAVYLNGLPTGGRPNGSQGLVAPLSLNFQNTTAGITLVKETNGVHDPDPNGSNVVQLAAGAPVTWTYLVTNTGNVSFPMANVVVTDNQPGVTPAPELSGGFVVGDVNHNNLLDPGETWTYTATGTAVDLVANTQGYIVVPGCDPNHTGNTQPVYENTGTVTITDTSLAASDISHYCNPATPGITLVKQTNGVHDPDPNGSNVVQLAAVAPVTWTYLVTNTGNVSFAMANVVVTDNQPGVTPAPELSGGFVVGDVNQNNQLDPGETWTYTATGTAVDLVANTQGYTVVPGCDPNHTGNTQPVYENTGTVNITDTSLTASDISHYCNPATPGIAMVKLTNGVHDPDPDGSNVVQLPVGAPVTWTYQVTNTGNVSFAMANVVVTDNQPGVTPAPELSGGFVVGDANQNNQLDPGETWTYTASGTALLLASPPPGVKVITNQAGQDCYENTGMVTVTGTGLTASDLSHYCQPALAPAVLSGLVFCDQNNNGLPETGDHGINNVTMTLTGTDTSGNPVNQVTTTTNLNGVDGSYAFPVFPGTYTITETPPAGYLDGIITPGGAGGTVGIHNISNIVITSSTTDSSGYNFAELELSSLAGFVYCDANYNGVKDANDLPVPNVVMTLTGTNDLGQPVNLSTMTDATGAYAFSGLREGTYAITETQPAGYLPFKITVGSLGGTVSDNDQIAQIPLLFCQMGSSYNFGQVLPASLSGFVYQDCDNNGMKEPTEPGIPGVTITLTGTDVLGNMVTLVQTTSSSGSYSFGSLYPGTYTVTETAPAGYIKGIDSIGTVGNMPVGTVGDRQLSNIVLNKGDAGINYNFGELMPGSLSGFVYYDLNHNGVLDADDYGIAHVTITLTGTNDQGQQINENTVTDENGYYVFDNLLPGTYTITETHPSAFRDYKDNVGSLGGTVSQDKFSNIPLAACEDGVNYNFGELQKPNCKLRDLAVHVGNVFYHFEQTYQRDPAAFAQCYPNLAPSIAAGQVPWGKSPFPAATRATYWVPKLGTKPILIFPVRGGIKRCPMMPTAGRSGEHASKTGTSHKGAQHAHPSGPLMPAVARRVSRAIRSDKK
jgi:hypothetical protein